MRTSTAILCGVSAVSLAASFGFWRQWEQQRSIIFAPQPQHAELKCQDAPVAAAPAPPVQPVPVSVPASDTAKSSPAAASASAYRPGRQGEIQLRLLKNPAYRKAFRNQQRLEIEQAYRDLPRALGLTPDQAGRLFDLMADQGVRIFDTQLQKVQDGKSKSDMYQNLYKQNEAELSDLLGASNMIGLNEYRATMQSRSEVDSIRNELARSPEPLREDQVDPMIAIVNTELQRMNQEMRDSISSTPNSMSPFATIERADFAIAANQRILDSSRGVLTGTQAFALEQLYRRQRLQMESQSEMARLQHEASGDNPPE